MGNASRVLGWFNRVLVKVLYSSVYSIVTIKKLALLLTADVGHLDGYRWSVLSFLSLRPRLILNDSACVPYS